MFIATDELIKLLAHDARSLCYHYLLYELSKFQAAGCSTFVTIKGLNRDH